MTKIVAYTALHYGKDYLASAIRSVIDHVDEYHALYTPIGSHGHRTDVPCPETRDELLEIALSAGSKLRWHEGEWGWEGQQRDTIFSVAPDADLILALDADEIWAEGLAQMVIESAAKHPFPTNFRVPIIHYWRSFHRCVLHDPAYPVRAISPKAKGQEAITFHPFRADTPDTPHDMPSHEVTEILRKIRAGEYRDEAMAINHMGYAQRSEIVNYKQLTHGHKGEWRRDVDWFNDKFMANAQVDCHPVGSDYWNPETVNYLDYMPAWMSDHPYAEMAVIP